MQNHESNSTHESRKVAIIGNVNTQEVFADRLKEESVDIDGFFTSPNKAFEELCSNAMFLNKDDLDGVFVQRLVDEKYDAIAIGPISACLVTSKILNKRGIPHSGATVEQMHFELDKTAALSLFEENPSVLPRSIVFDGTGTVSFKELLRNEFPNGYVLKFVGNYSEEFEGSEAGRVIFGTNTDEDLQKAIDFANRSMRNSGQVLIQEFLVGSEFSFNVAVDRNKNIFYMGSNRCYKHRGEGDTGPLSDGTGSISIDGSVPFLQGEDVNYIINNVVRPYVDQLTKRTGQDLVSMLNVDMMKTNDGRIVLFEVNCRAAGGHTASTMVSSLKTPLIDILTHMQQGTLDQITSEFHKGVSLCVSAYPKYYPYKEPQEQDLQEFRFPKNLPEGIKVFTGWVDYLGENEDSRTLRLHNAPSFIFHAHEADLKQARSRVYSALETIVGDTLDFRKDIGDEFE